MANGQLNGVIRHIRKLAGWQDISQLSDGQLLDRFIKDQDETAFEGLVQRHGPMVLGVCRRILGNHQDAEDAFQATFVVLVRKAASIRPRDMVANWLYGVACRASLKTRSLNCKRRSKEFEMAPTTEQFSSPKDVWFDVQNVLDEELERLPDKYRSPVVLCDLQGKSRKEAAGQLQIPEGTLSSRLNTARQMLAKKLTRRGVVLSAGGLATLLSDNVAAAASATAVPAALVLSTVKAAHVAAVGSTLAAGAMSTQAALVADGIVHGMFVTKLKIVAAVLLTAGLLTGGAGYVYYQSGAGSQRAEAKTAEIAQSNDKPAEKQPDQPQAEARPVILPDPPKPEPEEPKQPDPSVVGYKEFLKNGDAEIIKIRQAMLKKIDEEEKKTTEAIKNLKPGDTASLLQLQLHRQRLHNDRSHVGFGIMVGGTKTIAPPMPSQEQLLGIQVTSPTILVVKQLGLEKGQGIVIEKVDPDSPAAKAGLQMHDILLKIHGKSVPSDRKEFKKFLAEITSETSVEVVVLRAGKEQTLQGLILPHR